MAPGKAAISTAITIAYSIEVREMDDIWPSYANEFACEWSGSWNFVGLSHMWPGLLHRDTHKPIPAEALRSDITGRTGTACSSHARNNLYPIDRTIAPRKRPIAPIATNPPTTPRNTTAIGTATPRPSSRGFSTLSIVPTTTHQTRNITALVVLAIANT